MINGNKIIVSLVLIKAREKNLREVLNSLINQSLKPDMIYVWISKEPFYLDKGFDKKPNFKSPIVKIKFVENIGALRKIIPVLKEYWEEKETIIITTDDDHIWYKNFIKDLFNYQNKLNLPLSGRGIVFYNDDPNDWVGKRIHGGTIKKPMRADILCTGYGLTVRPKFFTEEIFDWKKYEKNGILYDDEFWLSGMLAKNNLKRFIVPMMSKQKNLQRGGAVMFTSSPSRNTKKQMTKIFKKIIRSV